MAKVVSYKFEQTLPQIIARDQIVAAGDSFILNGEEAVNGRFEYKGIIRTVSIWATLSDQSGNLFTITGTLYGETVSETINGPDATLGVVSEDTKQFFSTVTSVTVDNFSTIDLVSIGTGKKGYTNWFPNNTYSNYQSVTVQVFQGGDPADAQYTFQTTLEDVFSYGTSFTGTSIDQLYLEDRCTLGIVVPDVTGGGKSFKMTMNLSRNDVLLPFPIYTVSSTYAYPTRYSRVKLEAGITDYTGTFEIKMLEQG